MSEANKPSKKAVPARWSERMVLCYPYLAAEELRESRATIERLRRMPGIAESNHSMMHPDCDKCWDQEMYNAIRPATEPSICSTCKRPADSYKGGTSGWELCQCGQFRAPAETPSEVAS